MRAPSPLSLPADTKERPTWGYTAISAVSPLPPEPGELTLPAACVSLKSDRWPDSFLATTHGSSNECAYQPDQNLLLSFRAHGTTPAPPARAEPMVATY